MPSITPELMARQSNPDETNAASILAINAVFCWFTFVVVGLRIYVRTVMLKKMGVDDWICSGAMLMGVAVFICFLGEIHWGLGHHQADISLPHMIKILHWIFFHSIFVTVGISLVKISLAFFLLRFVPGKNQRYFLIGMAVFLIAFTVACVGTLVFACIPVDASWNLNIVATSHCYSKSIFTSIGLFNSCINIITDVLFASLPIPIVWNLHINKRTRITLIGILSLGFFACACSIVKSVLQSKFYTTPDYTFNDSYFVWNSIELYVGITAASLPALRPLFASLLDTTKNLTSRRNQSSNPNHKYYMQPDPEIGLENLPRSQGSKYRVTVTSHSLSEPTQRGGSEDEILPQVEKHMRRSSIVGIQKRVDVMVS
ncbi:integral membrane protein [Phlyctema vagabunda]|uniref:Integral membrane protein n=1 Tax=Phlyctema vagabunda TaxID=108571 RepID=A0ABR4PGX0_9HELO